MEKAVERIPYNRFLYSQHLTYQQIIEQYENEFKSGIPKAMLMYVTPSMCKIIERMGRMCYDSVDKITSKSYEGFIRGAVARGHESIIEHNILVYVIFKPSNKMTKYHANLASDMFELLSLNGLLTVNDMPACTIISGNIRMFKDLFRAYDSLNHMRKNNVIKSIYNTMFTLNPCLFSDFILDGKMGESEFRELEAFEDDKIFGFNQISKYVQHLSYPTYFDFTIEDYISPLTGKPITLKMTETILDRHNIETFIYSEPRSTSHQEVRHRWHSSYTQQSQRYINFANFQYDTPPTFETNRKFTLKDNTQMSLKDFMEIERDMYEAMVIEGIPKEDARCVLSQNVFSDIAVTRTRSVIKDVYVPLRTDKHAQYFIRENIAKPTSQYMDKNHLPWK